MSDNHYYYGAPSMGGVGTGSGFGFGNGNGIFDLAALLIVGGIFGGFGWGGGFGGGAAGVAGATATAAETAALVGQQQVADRVASINTGVDAVAGIATANGVKIETVKDAVTNGFYANQTSLCSLGNNIAQQFNAAAMNGMQNHNNLTSQLTEMRFANAQCCCDTKGLIQSSFCNLAHQLQSDKCDTMRAIAAEGEATRAMLRDIQTQRLQEELAAAKNQLSQNAQTSSIIAAVQASCAPKCSPCASSCNPCGNLFCSVQNAFADEIAQRIINPSTTTTAA